MKKILLILTVLFFCSGVFASWDFNKTISIKPIVKVVVDSNQNKFFVTIGSITNQYACNLDLNSTIDWETTHQLTRQDLNLEFLLDPLLSTLDLNEQVYKLEQLNSRCDINAMKEDLSAFKNAIDSSMSTRLSNFDAKLENTFLPKQTEFDLLKSKVGIAEEEQNRCYSDLNIARTIAATETKTKNSEIGLLEFERNILGTLLLVVSAALIFILAWTGYISIKSRKKIITGED